MPHENGFCWNGDPFHTRVRGYPTLRLLQVVHTLVSPIPKPQLSGPVASCDDENTCPRLLGMVEVIFTSLGGKVLSLEEEPSASGRKGKPSVVEPVKSKKGTRMNKVCIQETVIYLYPVDRTRLTHKHYVVEPGR